MVKIINPSRNEAAAAQRAKYGMVVRVPTLPIPTEKVENLVAFLETDRCFYKCESYIKNTRTFYRWKAVTTGGSRAFIIPVEKMDVSKLTPEIVPIEDQKESFTALINTVDEIINGLVRYDVIIQPLGGKKTQDSIYLDGKDYYKWNPDYEWNAVVENGVTTKMFVKLIAGKDYNIGDSIEGLIYELDESSPYQDITYEIVVNKINEIIKLLNTHNASIPSASVDKTLLENSIIVNLIIDEINPFSSLVDKVKELEGKIGKGMGTITNPFNGAIFFKITVDDEVKYYELTIYDDEDGVGTEVKRVEKIPEDAFVINGSIFITTNGDVYKLTVYDDETGIGVDTTRVTT